MNAEKTHNKSASYCTCMCEFISNPGKSFWWLRALQSRSLQCPTFPGRPGRQLWTRRQSFHRRSASRPQSPTPPGSTAALWSGAFCRTTSRCPCKRWKHRISCCTFWAHSMGCAQSVAPIVILCIIPSTSTRFMSALILTGTILCEKATTSVLGSVRTVTMLIAAEPFAAVMLELPRMGEPMEPLTSESDAVPQPGRLHKLEGLVEGALECLFDVVHGIPLQLPSVSSSCRVCLSRCENVEGVNACLAQCLLVVQPLNDHVAGRRVLHEQPDARHLGQVAEHGRHGHLLEQCFPHDRAVEVLGGQVLAHELSSANRISNILCTLHCLHVFRCSEKLVDSLQILLEFGLAVDEVLLCFEQAAHSKLEDEVENLAFSFRMRQTQDVAVTPAVAILVLGHVHGQRRSIVLEASVPLRNRSPVSSSPPRRSQTAHLLTVLDEDEQMRWDPTHFRQSFIRHFF